MAFIDILIEVFLILAIVIIFARGVVIIQPYEQALNIRLGKFTSEGSTRGSGGSSLSSRLSSNSTCGPR